MFLYISRTSRQLFKNGQDISLERIGCSISGIFIPDGIIPILYFTYRRFIGFNECLPCLFILCLRKQFIPWRVIREIFQIFWTQTIDLTNISLAN